MGRGERTTAPRLAVAVDPGPPRELPARNYGYPEDLWWIRRGVPAWVRVAHIFYRSPVRKTASTYLKVLLYGYPEHWWLVTPGVGLPGRFRVQLDAAGMPSVDCGCAGAQPDPQSTCLHQSALRFIWENGGPGERPAFTVRTRKVDGVREVVCEKAVVARITTLARDLFLCEVPGRSGILSARSSLLLRTNPGRRCSSCGDQAECEHEELLRLADPLDAEHTLTGAVQAAYTKGEFTRDGNPLEGDFRQSVNFDLVLQGRQVRLRIVRLRESGRLYGQVEVATAAGSPLLFGLPELSGERAEAFCLPPED